MPERASMEVPKEQILKAVDSLVKWEESAKQAADKTLLLEDDKLFYLVVSLKNPSLDRIRVNPYQIRLPHPIFDIGNGGTHEVCLFVGDGKGQKRKETKRRIAEEGIPIAKVISISKLRTNYREYEARRKLCGSYDLFLAERSVLDKVLKLLGKSFIKKKKQPIPVELQLKDWKKQIENACSSTSLYLKGGTCSVVKVGRLSQTRDQVCDNVVAAIERVTSCIPKKWKNVKSLYLKTAESVPLPLYQSLPDLPLKISVT